MIAHVRVDGHPPGALGAQDPLDALPQDPVPAPRFRDEVGDGLDLGRRVRHRHGQAGTLERGEVQQVVADIGDRVGGHAVLGHQGLETLPLPPRPDDDAPPRVAP